MSDKLYNVTDTVSQAKRTSQDIPAHRFHAPLDEHSKGFVPLVEH